jgi:membrane associated rhomboid family serine protease
MLAAFLVQKTADSFFSANFLGLLGLVPQLAIMNGYVWQIFTYALLHADVTHLVFNLLLLVFVGSELEAIWGKRRFLIFFFFCTAVAGLTYLLLQLAFWSGNQPLVGASGGLYGLLVAYGMVFGDRVLLLMMLFPLKARHFIWVLAGIEFLTGVFSGAPSGALGSFAHLGGMVGGLAYLYGRGWWLVRQKRQGGGSGAKRRPSHLRLVPKDGGTKSSGQSSGSSGDDQGPPTWH